MRLAMALNLTETPIAEALRKSGTLKLNIEPPANLKIQVTGDQGEIIFNDGPKGNKKWDIEIVVQISEHS
jgi:hypothetical protein